MTDDASIVGCFEEVVAASPEAVALRWRDGAFSYAELNARANQLAHFLADVGIDDEAPVGVFAFRSPETLVAFLAILKAGGAYVPLDPTIPQERIKFYVEDAGIGLILADHGMISDLPPTSAKVVSLNCPDFDQHSKTNLGRKTGLHSLAHVLFTSGSTGRPKGVLIEHRGVVRLVKNFDYIKVAPKDVFLQYAPLSFDASTFEIWGAWLNGATVAVPPAEQRSLHELGAALRDFRVTTLWLTSGLFQAMVEQEFEALAGVRQLLTGGDVVSPEHAERFLRRFPGVCLVNGYGPTENTVFSSCHRVILQSPMPARLSIGRPIQKTGVLIVDDRFVPVAAGETGEMIMTGEGLARGYLNRPELTAGSFIECTDTAGKTGRGYRSGDLGRYNPDGTIDFLGRIDDQVKINGLRIEPGEIKNVLKSHPQITDAEVLVAERNNAKRLEAFVVMRPDAQAKESVLRSYLAEKLPPNWLPAGIHFVPRFPLNANGKVNRRALLDEIAVAPTPDADDPGLKDEPSEVLEKAIWSLWREIFPGQRIGLHDRFFDLGGDSLTALRMIAQVEKMIQRPIGLGSLLEGGTIADVAAAARETGPILPQPLMTCTQAGANKSPFFFAHGDYVCGGLYCQRIAHRLDADQPFYALAPHGTFGGELLDSMEEVAASFVEMIRSVQPKGPYHLGGFCNGAIAMYEAAQQLIRAGEAVASLVLLDPPDLYLFLFRRRLARLGKRLGLQEDRNGRSMYQRVAEGVEMWQYYGPRYAVKDFCQRLYYWSRKKVTKTSVPGDQAGNLNMHYHEIIARYEPRSYLGRSSVWIMLREGEKRRSSRQCGYWSEFIPGVHFSYIPGTHLELNSSLPDISAIIQKALESASSADDAIPIAGIEEKSAEANHDSLRDRGGQAGKSPS